MKPFITLSLIVVVSIFLGACATPLHLKTSVEPSLVNQVEPNQYDTVLVLGAGGIRSVGLIGALKAFEEANIKIDAFVASSGGSIISYLYASGLSSDEIYKIVLENEKSDLLDINLSRYGLVKGIRLIEKIKEFGKVENFEELKTPIYIQATDLSNSKIKVFYKKEISPALRASISIPGTFYSPIIGGNYYVDAGVMDILPVDLVVNRFKYKRVFALDVYCHDSALVDNNVIDILLHSQRLSGCQKVKMNMEKYSSNKDINFLQLGFEPKSSSKLNQIEEIYKNGYEIAKQYLENETIN